MKSLIETLNEALRIAERLQANGLMLPYSQIETQAALQTQSAQLNALARENATLTAFAERHGWKTADGVYVAGRDDVYYCACEYSPSTPMPMRLPFKPWLIAASADEVAPSLRRNYFASRSLAEVCARKEWEDGL